MKYSMDEVIQYTHEEDVKFIRLSFCDVFGRQKNISIMPDELPRAFEYGIAFDASAIAGFGGGLHSDMMLHPEPETLMPLPWRPEHGSVVHMFSNITYPDGKPFECDTRSILKNAVKSAQEAGLSFSIGSEMEFYLFLLDEAGRPTREPQDCAGYMDIAPEDHGENVRREVCLTLEKMGIRPESSHHEEGPGQNEIDFRYSDPLTAADNALIFQRVVKAIAFRNGLYSDFSPKPLKDRPGNGFHINFSLKGGDQQTLSHVIAGVLDNIKAMTLFLDPSEDSYRRLGSFKAPRYISWSSDNRSQLIRIPAAEGEYRRMELRSPDPEANPYLAYALMLHAAADGIERKIELAPPADVDLYKAGPEVLSGYDRLPSSYEEACSAASSSEFIKRVIPQNILDIYRSRNRSGAERDL